MESPSTLSCTDVNASQRTELPRANMHANKIEAHKASFFNPMDGNSHIVAQVPF